MSNECVKPEIPQFPELTFEEERHLYYLNGLEVPSVTTLMKPLSSDFYSTVDPEVLNRAAKRGTAIHNAVENYAKFGIEDIPPMYAGYLRIPDWWNSRKPEVLAIERRSTTNPAVCRYGRSAVYYQRPVDVGGLQDICAGQQQALCSPVGSLRQGMGEPRHQVDDRLILHLSKKGYQEVKFSRSGKCWSVFSSLMTIKNYMNE